MLSMRRSIGFGLLILLPCLLAAAPQVQEGTAPSVELRAVDEFLESLIEDERVVACSAQIARGGEILYREAFGELEQGSGRALGDDSIFRIYSMTKPITAAAVMMLWEEDRFELDDPIGNYIPELADMKLAQFPPGERPSLDNMQLVDPSHPVTIRNLLRHDSGMPYGFFKRGPVPDMYRDAKLYDPANDLDTFAERLGKLPLMHEPGERMTYGVNSDVLGLLVQRISGRPFDEFLEERLFDPLGMVDTGFFVTEEQRDRLADAYVSSDGKIAGLSEKVRAPYHSRPKLPTGGAGLVSTLGDYGRFCQMILNGGTLDEARILSPETVELMTTIPVPRDPGGREFGLGFMIVHDVELAGKPAAVASQCSWGGLARTAFFLNPEQDFYAIFMTQVFPHSTEFEDALFPLVYEGLRE